MRYVIIIVMHTEHGPLILLVPDAAAGLEKAEARTEARRLKEEKGESAWLTHTILLPQTTNVTALRDIDWSRGARRGKYPAYLAEVVVPLLRKGEAMIAATEQSEEGRVGCENPLLLYLEEIDFDDALLSVLVTP